MLVAELSIRKIIEFVWFRRKKRKKKDLKDKEE